MHTLSSRGTFALKSFLFRILLAAALVLLTLALEPLARAQQADDDPAPTASRPQGQAPASAKPQQQVPARSPSDDQTQQALAFTGRITNEEGQIVLKDPVTKMTYHLDDPAKVKAYIGKKVKIVGKLAMKSNTIHIDSIEPLS